MAVKLKYKANGKGDEKTPLATEESKAEITTEAITAVDRIAVLETYLAEHSAQVADEVQELGALKTTLRDIADQFAEPDEKVTIYGLANRAEIGAKGLKRTVSDIVAVRAMMGAKQFDQLCSIPLKAIDDYLTPPQREKVLEVERSGTRSLSVKEGSAAPSIEVSENVEAEL